MGTRDYIMSQSIGGVTIAVRSLKKGNNILELFNNFSELPRIKSSLL